MRMENGETLWRPLNNASVMRHQTFAANNIRGFGLLQRDRNFADYQDMFNFYQMTPSVWVEPRGHWGDGEMHLLELSTQYEGLDNIVAFWDPKGKPAPLQPFHFSYTMYWTRETDMKLSQNKVVLTRVGVDPRNDKWREIVVDFNGPKLDALPTNAVPEAIASCSTNAAIVEKQVFHVPFNGDWRTILKMEQKPGNQDPVDLRCTLKKGEEALTETWTYHWSPP
jgi:glucans biosynthesis protein